jgi:hypothetical protein
MQNKSRIALYLIFIWIMTHVVPHALAQGPPLFQSSWGSGGFWGDAMVFVNGTSGSMCVSSVANPYPNPPNTTTKITLTQPYSNCTVGNTLSENTPLVANGGSLGTLTGASSASARLGTMTATVKGDQTSDGSGALDDETSVAYYQEDLPSPVPPGSQLSLTFQVSASAGPQGSASLNITLVSDDPTQSAGYAADVVPEGSGGSFNNTVTTNPLTIGPSGKYSIYIKAGVSECCLETATITVGTGDTVTLSNTSGQENGIWVNGMTMDGQQWSHQAFTSRSDTIPLGANLVHSSKPYGDEVVAFTQERPVSIFDGFNWSFNDDNIPIAFFPASITLPVTVWIIEGPYTQQREMMSWELSLARQIYGSERMGIIPALSIDMIDATAFASDFSRFDCTKTAALKTSGLYRPATINVYVINVITNSLLGDINGTAGETCGSGGDIIGITTRPLGVPGVLGFMNNPADTLAHELGHSLYLIHSGFCNPLTGYLNGNLPDFDNSNLMWSGLCRTADYLSEGQVFRANLDERSQLNILGLHPLPLRNCSQTEPQLDPPQGDPADGLACPSLDKRIWQDGPNFPPN